VSDMTSTKTRSPLVDGAGLGCVSCSPADEPPSTYHRETNAQDQRTGLGIDIGFHGGLALLTPARDLIDVADLPSLPDGLQDAWPSTALCSHLYSTNWAPAVAYVEFVSSRPDG